MEYKAPRAEDISYSYDTRGYMMYYKGQPIGGGGIANDAKGCRSNLSLFRHYGEVTKKELVRGGGSQYMKDCILKIDQAERGEHHDKQNNRKG